MSLITPDFGLLVWMTLIFGIVFFILAKFGFPMITGMVDDRADRISKAISQAKEAEQRMQDLAKEQQRLLEEARKERNDMLKEASATGAQLIQQAKADAQAEADKIIARTKEEIAAERESALRAVRSEVAELSMRIAEKVIRKDLEGDAAQSQYIDRLIEEMSSDKTERTNS
ncbi:MAG: F0F1 ATP synthase subunit B [Bacteroidales bacterium]|nr:F0F1 ATP synthase subunit B [Bacteroidales bacterium]